MNLTSPQVIKRIMNSQNLKFNKNLGQNFLTDDTVLEKIVEVSGLDEKTGVLEVGAGIGTLTEALSGSAGKVVSIELDRSIYEYLKDAFVAYSNVEIIQGDALKVDLHKVIEENLSGLRPVICANLPYYITTPLIMKFLEDALPVESITVMVQKEVAERMAAVAGSKEYGALSLAVQYYSTPKIIVEVPPESFMPAPKVTSAVIHLDLKNHKKPEVEDEKRMFAVIKAAFEQRRKTLVNALSSKFSMPKEEIKELIKTVCGNENVRGEVVSLEKFIEISEKIY